MATTYCVRADIESILGEAAVLACIDDDQDGLESATETTFVTGAISRAAVEMNTALENQYILSELTANEWCKWCNAYIAAWHLYARRSNPPPNSIVDSVQAYRELLAEIRWGRIQVPEQNPSREHKPTVSVFKPEIWKTKQPIRVDTDESTGSAPHESIKRPVANIEGNL